MNRVIKLMQWYLLIGLPIIIFFIILKALNLSGVFAILFEYIPKIGWNMLGLGLMVWFLVLFIFLVLIVAVPAIREEALRGLANLKERDEREHYITGQASRVAYISTLSLMLFLLFLSTFSIDIYKNNQVVEGHHHTLNMGFHYSFFDKETPKTQTQDEVIFDSDNYALSKPTIILILLGWQLVTFNLTARKKEREDI